MKQHPASFRDPSGYIFKTNGTYYRSVQPSYFQEYYAIKKDEIYEKLWIKKWLIPHKEIAVSEEEIILEPEQIPFISYPYEWSFTQYKHAAQLSLRMQLYLLENDYSLKDASAFNVTFSNGRAVFIDTLSIEIYKDNTPWRALKQFNEHFLAPLILTKYYGTRHLQTLKDSINGIPLKEVSKLLPWKTYLNPILYSNIHLLGKHEINHHSDSIASNKVVNLSKASQVKILKALDQYIGNLEINEKTEWSDYYSHTNYKPKAFSYKSQLLNQWVDQIYPSRIIDLGGNDGTFVRSLRAKNILSIITDIDANAVDQNYKQAIAAKEANMIPVVMDIMQSSPAIGFNNQERDSLKDRITSFQPEITFALALIHHLTLSGNVPFEMSAPYFASISPYLIIEFPEKNDSWVQYILKSKRDARHLFEDYSMEAFAKAYIEHFDIIEQQAIPDSSRTLFLMKRHEG